MRPIWADEQLAPAQPIWRYFRTDRLIEALTSRSLYFPSAREFKDPFEGAVAVLAHDFPVDPRYPSLSDLDMAFEQLRRLTKISCWHLAGYESDAMWQLYAMTGKGAAVRSTVRRLQDGLQSFRLAATHGEEEPYWGAVRYVDLHTERLRTTMESRFFYKHRAFESEQEFRVAISLRMAEEFGVEVPEHGIHVSIVPEVLIESIYLGPKLPTADREAIVQACTAVGLTPRLVTSTLLGQPRYT